MSDNDLIKYGDVRVKVESAIEVLNNLGLTWGIYSPLWDAIDAIRDIPAVPQEMSARELLLTENRMIIQDDYAFGDYSALVWQMKMDEAVAFARNWAREHPEIDMMTAKYALPRIDFNERSEK